ncbi:MAG: hypothetical protein P8171_13680 [Candidatus Thiodiazotropha sp.]
MASIIDNMALLMISEGDLAEAEIGRKSAITRSVTRTLFASLWFDTLKQRPHTDKTR